MNNFTVISSLNLYHVTLRADDNVELSSKKLGCDNYFVARSRSWSCTWTYNQETAGPESRPGSSYDRKKGRLLTSFLWVQVNPVHSKELNEIRTAGKEENVCLTPPRMVSVNKSHDVLPKIVLSNINVRS